MLRWIATAAGGAVEVGLGLSRAARHLEALPDPEGAAAWLVLSILGAGAVLAGSRCARLLRPSVVGLHVLGAVGVFGSVAFLRAMERAHGIPPADAELALRTGFLLALVGLATSALDAPCVSLASRRTPA